MACAIEGARSVLSTRFKPYLLVHPVLRAALNSHLEMTALASGLFDDATQHGRHFPVGDRNAQGHAEITDSYDRHELVFAAIEMTEADDRYRSEPLR